MSGVQSFAPKGALRRHPPAEAPAEHGLRRRRVIHMIISLFITMISIV